MSLRNTLNSSDLEIPKGLHWHIYPPQQIKPEFKGDNALIIAINKDSESLVMYKPKIHLNNEMDFPLNPLILIPRLISQQNHGIVYYGVSENKICKLWKFCDFLPSYFFDDKEGRRYYNKQVIDGSMTLLQGRRFTEDVDPFTLCLLTGKTHLLNN